jgi:hypothetical protein
LNVQDISNREINTDIIINLLTGHLVYSDRKFTEYIEKSKDEYEEGTDVTYQDLMRKVECKYQVQQEDY